MSRYLLSVATLWHREVKRFYRERARVIGGFAPPLVFWFLIGSGLGNSFSGPGLPSGTTYLQYFFPGTILLIVLFTAIFSTISVIEDRHEGFLQAVLAAPVPRSCIVLGKVLGSATISCSQGLAFLALAPAVGLPVRAELLPFVLAELVLVAIGLAGLGFCLAWTLDSTQGFHAVMNLFLIPMWLLSGALFPPAGAPRWLRLVMAGNPVTYAVAALQRGLLQGGGGDGPSAATCLAVTGAFALAMIAAASAAVGRSARS
ncbi:MAG: ABC transporter permease [Elusimicrobia bacterium]|nr:ABC transporter permease [Elusimicrobiota bacterium]